MVSPRTRRTIVDAMVASWAVLAIISPAWGETIDQAYRRALTDLVEGRYAKAAEGLERVAAVPTRHEDVYYNLGCAYFRLGKLGLAIYNFERSLVLDAGGDDARFNLAAARNVVSTRVKDVLKGVPNETFWGALVSTTSTRGWWVALLVAWWIFFALLLVVRRLDSGPARSGLIAATALVALVTLGAGGLLAGSLHRQRAKVGIVLPDRLPARQGPSSGARETFKLHAGLRATVQAEASGWLRIRLANGLEGWVERRDLGLL